MGRKLPKVKNYSTWVNFIYIQKNNPTKCTKFIKSYISILVVLLPNVYYPSNTKVGLFLTQLE